MGYLIVHAFVIKLDQVVYWCPRKKKEKIVLYKVNGELFSCGTTDSNSYSLERVKCRDLNKALQNYNSEMDYPNLFKLLPVGLLSTHSIHIVWGNFSFNSCYLPQLNLAAYCSMSFEDHSVKRIAQSIALKSWKYVMAYKDVIQILQELLYTSK